MATNSLSKQETPKLPVTDGDSSLTVEVVYQKIRQRICTLVYPFNTPLRENELAIEFGMSRTPIRAVLQRLKADGLIDVRHGVGNIVIAGDRQTFEDTYTLRIEIAELIGRLSPRLHDENAIDRLEALLTPVKSLRKKFNADSFWDINENRHQVVNSIIGNMELAKLHDLYYHKVAPFWFSLVLENPDREVQLLESELEETVGWMKSGDLKAVAFTHRNHTAYGMLRAQKLLQSQDNKT